MACFDLTDFEWTVIQPLLPTKVRGVKWVYDRRALNGIFWWLRTGDLGQIFHPATACIRTV
jgi:transposase